MNSSRNRQNFSSLFLIVTVFSFVLVFMRFSQIMVHGEIDGEDLRENVVNLYTRNQTLQADRGTIYDRHGNPLAIDATSYKMIAVLTDKWSTPENPQHVQNKEAIASILANHINLSKEDVLEFLNKDVDQVEFGAAGRNLSYHTTSHIKQELNEQNLKGIVFEEKKKRLYPNGTFASHTVGLAQYPTQEEDSGTKQLVGVMGLESSFNDLLTGTNGERSYQKDSLGYLVPRLENYEIEPQDGDDLYLTFDHKLQVHLESILNIVQEENSPKAVTATVINPKNGEIIASAQRPSFNATTLENIDASWQNLLTEYTFEPGSTMKVITLAAAIQEGVFNPNKYFETGTIRIHGEAVRDHNNSGWGWVSYLEGLSRSSNVLMVELIEAMGHDVWKEYLDAFGFGQATGVSLPYEQNGNNPYGSMIQKVNTGFGQGISVTPIQMLQAFTAIANEGQMMKPKFLNKTIDKETGEENVFEPEVANNPITPETAKATLSYLKQATEMDVAVARNYKVEGQSVAAKTGTAQIYDAELNRYSSTKYVYSVTAAFPAEDPEYLVYITVQEPNLTPDATSGSAVVQKIYHPLVKRIVDFNDSSDNQSAGGNIHYIETPSFLDMSVEEAQQQVQENEIDYTLIGTGTEVVQQLPYPDTPLFEEQQVILMTSGAATMPDLTNWSRNDAMKVAELTGVNMVFSGEGYVVSQSLAPGLYMDPGEEIQITLSQEVIQSSIENDAITDEE